MKNIKKFKIFTLLLILLAVSISSIAPVLAKSDLITIKIDDTLKDKGISISGRRLKIWKISENRISGDLTKKLSDFEKLTDEELDRRYKKNFITKASNDRGEIFLENLEDGTYYVREFGDDKIISPFFIIIPMKENIIYPKINIPNNPYNPPDNPNKPPHIPEEPTGKISFRKVSKSENKFLKGARFKVSRKVDGYFYDVYIDNKLLMTESDKDGLFSFELPYGTYYLSEVVPPKGYRPLTSSVKFVVDGDSIGTTIIINNDLEETPPNNPDKPNEPNRPSEKPKRPMPKTGDITLIVMIVAGVLLSFMGTRLIKEDKSA